MERSVNDKTKEAAQKCCFLRCGAEGGYRASLLMLFFSAKKEISDYHILKVC